MLDTYYPLENCKSPFFYNPKPDLRVKYFPLKRNGGELNYKYVNMTGRYDDNDGIFEMPQIFEQSGIFIKIFEQTGFVIQNVGRLQNGTYNGNLKKYVIYFSDRFPNLQRIIINNTLANKGIVPYIYEYGTVENENNENIYYWISDYYIPIKPLDDMCKQDILSLPSAYEMFYNTLSILHKENYVITEFNMSKIFLGRCDSYLDNIETIFCICNYDKWFNHIPHVFNRDTRKNEIRIPRHNELEDFYNSDFPIESSNRYSSIRNYVTPIDNWMSVMFILLDAMDMFIPDCITISNLMENFKKEKKDYRKIIWENHPEIIYEFAVDNHLDLIKKYKENFMIYINSIFASIIADNLGNIFIDIDYIEKNIGTFVNKVSEKTGIEMEFYCLFITCLIYISHVNHLSINYVNDNFMKELIDTIKQYCIVYTCKFAYNNKEKFINDLIANNSEDDVNKLICYIRQQTQNYNIDIINYVQKYGYLDFSECLYMCNMNIPKYKISVYSLNAYATYKDIINTQYCKTNKLCVNTKNIDFVINYVNIIMNNITSRKGTLSINKKYLINNDYLLRMYKCANEYMNNHNLNITYYFLNTDINNIDIPNEPMMIFDDYSDHIRKIIDCSKDDDIIFGDED